MPDSRQPRLVLLEVSKVRNYHSTLVDGLIQAYGLVGLAERFGRPRLYAHDSFFAHLGPDSRAAVDFEPIAVMDPDKGKRALKSLHEAWQIVRRLAKLERNEILFVTTVFPSAMVLVEMVKWFMPGRRMIVLQHSELEGRFDENVRFGSYPHLNLIWHGVRRLGSTIRLAVLDHFIASAVLSRYQRSVKADGLYVIPLPMNPVRDLGEDRSKRRPRCCFVGFVTPAKGYETFLRLAEALPELDFHIIGGGRETNVRTGAETGFGGLEFLDALSRCDFAIMPYVSGYSCSLSAAAADAVAAGLHLIATPRPCFVALADTFGPATVSICEGEAEMLTLLSDPEWVRARVAERAQRLSRIDGSPYDLRNVGRALGDMIEGMASRASVPADRPRSDASRRAAATITSNPEGQSR